MFPTEGEHMAKNPGTVMERMVQVIHDQPDDSSYEEILRELAFAAMIERGLKDVDEGRVISHEEMGRKIASWGK
jgi:predicted transcriptional regulator